MILMGISHKLFMCQNLYTCPVVAYAQADCIFASLDVEFGGDVSRINFQNILKESESDGKFFIPRIHHRFQKQ